MSTPEALSEQVAQPQVILNINEGRGVGRSLAVEFVLGNRKAVAEIIEG